MIFVEEHEGDDIDLCKEMRMMICVKECEGDDCKGDDLRRKRSGKEIKHYQLVLDWHQTASSNDTSKSEE